MIVQGTGVTVGWSVAFSITPLSNPAEYIVVPPENRSLPIDSVITTLQSTE